LSRRCCAGTVISPLLLGRDEVVDGLAFLESLLHLNQLLDAVDQQLHELALHTHNGRRRRRDLQQLDADETPRISALHTTGGSVAEWLACWTQKARVQIAAAALSGNSLKQTVHTHCASVHQAAKLVAALLRVVGVTAGLAESNGSLPSGL